MRKRDHVGSRITRSEVTFGLTTVAFYYPGLGPYQAIDLQIYSDGMIHGSGNSDLTQFAEKLQSGTILPTIPNGQRLSFHHLGTYHVAQGRWSLDADGLLERVRELVRTMNPAMENLRNAESHHSHDEAGRRVSYSLRGYPAREERSPSGYGPMRSGSEMNVFVRKDDDSVYLAQLRIFKEGIIEVGGLAEPEEIPTENIFEQIASGRFLTQIASDTGIEILGLGSFVASEARGEHTSDDLVREIRDMQDSFAGQPTSGQRCARAWKLFQDAPMEASQLALREAYESVPTHLRLETWMSKTSRFEWRSTATRNSRSGVIELLPKNAA